VDGKYLMRFQNETSAFKFFWRSVDVAFTHIKGQNEENQYFSIRIMATLLDCKTIFLKLATRMLLISPNSSVVNFFYLAISTYRSRAINVAS